MPLSPEQIETLLPAFQGIEVDDLDIQAVVKRGLPSGAVELLDTEIEAVAGRILELQTIVSQNALTRDDLPTDVQQGWSA